MDPKELLITALVQDFVADNCLVAVKKSKWNIRSY